MCLCVRTTNASKKRTGESAERLSKRVKPSTLQLESLRVLLLALEILCLHDETGSQRTTRRQNGVRSRAHRRRLRQVQRGVTPYLSPVIINPLLLFQHLRDSVLLTMSSNKRSCSPSTSQSRDIHFLVSCWVADFSNLCSECIRADRLCEDAFPSDTSLEGDNGVPKLR